LRALPVALIAIVCSGCFGFGGPGPKDFVADSKYDSMLIDVLYPQDDAPSESAIGLLVDRAEARLSKPGGIEVKKTAYAGESRTYSARDLRNLADDVSTEKSGGGRVVLTVLYVHGHSDQDTGNSKVLGVFFQDGRIAMFSDAIGGGGLLGSPFGASEVEGVVLVHEFGHAIGLVNLGLSMQRDHEDDEHPKHSSNSQSVMFWKVETTLGLASITGTLPSDFDSDDRADLQAAGGK
jgi:hypothetical protein